MATHESFRHEADGYSLRSSHVSVDPKEMAKVGSSERQSNLSMALGIVLTMEPRRPEMRAAVSSSGVHRTAHLLTVYRSATVRYGIPLQRQSGAWP